MNYGELRKQLWTSILQYFGARKARKMNSRDMINLNFSREKFCQHDVEYRVLETASQLKLKILAVDSGVWCIESSDLAHFNEDDKKTQQYGAHLEPYYSYAPDIPSELVVAKVGELWYRCLYLRNTSAEEVLLFAIDYGVKMNAKKENIRVRRQY